jgi:hypothetical protein
MKKSYSKHHTYLFFPIHHYFQRMREADVTYILGLFNGWHFVKNFLSENAITPMGIDGEITHAEGGEVLEEMSALRGIYKIVLQAEFYDDARCRYVWPLDGDA